MTRQNPNYCHMCTFLTQLTIKFACTYLQDLKVDGPLPEKVSCYQGVFYNYFSIGMW